MSTNLYSIGVRLWATLYVKAPDINAAKKLAHEAIAGAVIEVKEDPEAWLPIVGKAFRDPDLAAITLAPAMTFNDHTPCGLVELVATDVPMANVDFDGPRALAEGWSIFDVDGTGVLEVQRYDDAAVFASDDEARAFVAKKAAAGSEFHKQALAIVAGTARPKQEAAHEPGRDG